MLRAYADERINRHCGCRAVRKVAFLGIRPLAVVAEGAHTKHKTQLPGAPSTDARAPGRLTQSCAAAHWAAAFPAPLTGLFGDGPVARLSGEQWRGTDLLYLGLCERDKSDTARSGRAPRTLYTNSHC